MSEHWIVDPDLDIVRVYRRQGEEFDRPIELRAESGNVLTTPLLPEVQLPLPRIFRL